MAFALIGPPPVIGPQYCLPFAKDLTLVKEASSSPSPSSSSGPSRGRFSVSDSDGNLVFHIHGAPSTFCEKPLLRNANGDTLLLARRKILTIHDAWIVYCGEGGEELFTVKKTKVLQFETSLDVFLANSGREEPDFKVKGDYLERNCLVSYGPNIVAQVKRKFTVGTLVGRNTFIVTVYPMVDYAFIAALIVIMDEL